MLSDLLQTLLGVLAGIVTGLIPGVHVNLVATTALALGASAQTAVMLVSLSVVHSFLDAIPGVLLGAPESDTALGVLPGHRYVLRGWGLMAVKLTLVGSYLGLLLAMALIPLWLLVIRLYPFLVNIMGYLLLGISAYMIARDSKRGWALTVYLLSGALGYVLLNRPILEEPLFPLFSGLFGISTLVYSLTQRSGVPPQQTSTDIKLRRGSATQAVLAGNVSGFLTSMLPGLGAAQAAILGMHLTRRIGDHGFLIMIGTINTVNFSLSLLTWLALDKARNGAIVAVGTLLEPSPVIVARLLAVALIAGSIAVPLCLLLGRAALRLIDRLDYRKLVFGVVAFIILLVAVLTGWRGLLVLVVSTSVGFIPAIARCGRAHAMGCLLLPVALFFLT